MPNGDIEEALRFKLCLEQEFEAAAGVEGRTYYSAIYSLPQKSPVMWINLNPGGTPENHQVLSNAQLAAGQHEFWHGYGRTSKATGSFLEKVFRAPLDQLRSIQGTNVAWERSQKGGDINLRAAARRAAPFLTRYIQHARPNTLIFGGSAALDLLLTSIVRPSRRHRRCSWATGAVPKLAFLSRQS